MARIGRSRPARTYLIRTSERFYLSTTTPVPANLAAQAMFPAPGVAVSPAPSALATAAPTFTSAVRAVTALPAALSVSAVATAALVTIPATASVLTAAAAFTPVVPLINAAVIAGLSADLPPPAVTLTVPGLGSLGAAAVLGAPVIASTGSANLHPAALSIAAAFAIPAVTCGAVPSPLDAIAAVPAAAANLSANPSAHTVQATASLAQAAVTITAVVFESVGATLPAPIVKVTVARATLSQAPVISAATFAGPTILGGSATVGPSTLNLSASLPLPLASGLFAVAVVPNWMSNGEYIHRLYDLDPATADFYFNTPNAFSVGTTNSSSPVQDGFLSTPVLRYTSYNTFLADVNSNAINTSIFEWVMYDLEDWGDNFIMSTQAECNDPWDYMAYFTTLAHENGFSVILAPGQDLGNDATSLNPKLKGETNQAWYIRTNIAGAAAGTGAEIVEIQDQNNTATRGTFETFYFNALTQVQAASTTCQVWCGLSTSYGTAAQMLAAYESLLGWCDGIWMNASDATIALMDSFMSSIPVSPQSFAAAASFTSPSVTVMPQVSAFDAVATLPAASASTPSLSASVSPSALHAVGSLPTVAVSLAALPNTCSASAQISSFGETYDDTYNTLFDEASGVLMDESYGPLLEEVAYDNDVVTVVVAFLPSLEASATLPAPSVSTTAPTPSALALAATFTAPVLSVKVAASVLHLSATLPTVTPTGQPTVTALNAVAVFPAVRPVINVPAVTGFAATLPSPAIALTVAPAAALQVAATLVKPVLTVTALAPEALVTAGVTFTAVTTTAAATPPALAAVAGLPPPALTVRPSVTALAVVATFPAPTVVAGQSAITAPAPLDAVASFPAPMVSAGAGGNAFPSALALTAAFGSPVGAVTTPPQALSSPAVTVGVPAVHPATAVLNVTATFAAPSLAVTAVPGVFTSGALTFFPSPSISSGTGSANVTPAAAHFTASLRTAAVAVTVPASAFATSAVTLPGPAFAVTVPIAAPVKALTTISQFYNEIADQAGGFVLDQSGSVVVDESDYDTVTVTPSVSAVSAATSATAPVPAVAAQPSAVLAAAAFGAPTIGGASTATPAAFDAVAAFGGPGVAVTVTPAAFDAAATLTGPAALADSVLPATLVLAATFGIPTVAVGSSFAATALAAALSVPAAVGVVTASPVSLEAAATISAPAAVKDIILPSSFVCIASFPAPVLGQGATPAVLDAVAVFGARIVTLTTAVSALHGVAAVPATTPGVTVHPSPLQSTTTLTPTSGAFVAPSAPSFPTAFPSPAGKVTVAPATLHVGAVIPASYAGTDPGLPLAGYVTFPAPVVAAVAPTFGPWCFTSTEQDANQFGGGWTHGNVSGGQWFETNLYGGTESDVNPYLGLGIFGYGGSANAGMYNGTADCGCFVTMEAVNITIGQFNDETIDLTITNSGSPFNLNSPQYGLQVLLKTAAGVLDNDPSTVILTSDGENPAITIAAGSNGLATLVIPHDVLETTAFTFWRCDVTTPNGQQATAMYGLVSVKQL